jgi:septum site-determining protein MinC
MPKSQVRKPIEVKIATVVAVSALLNEFSADALKAALHDMTGGASDYFENEFTIIDLANMAEDQPVDWTSLIWLFKSHNLNPVAVRNAPETMEAQIIAHGLSIDRMPAPRPAQAQPQEEKKAVQAPAKPEPARQQTASAAAPAGSPAPERHAMIVDQPVRGGQRIYAQGCDLIVTAAVNPGAEVIADGSIHVYAPLRGRALAGASGNNAARIFAMSMEAELLSIAGIYRTFENGLPEDVSKRQAQVKLSGDRLELLSMSAAVRS